MSQGHYHPAPFDLVPMILSVGMLACFGVAAPYETALQFRRRSNVAGLGSIAEGNRHGGAHKHRREVARRLRQAERRSA